MAIYASSHLTVVLVTRLIVLLTVIIASVHLLHRHTISVHLILLTIILYFLTRSEESHIVLVTAGLVSICALAEHNNFVLRLRVLPASEDEQVRADGCRCMAETDRGRLTEVLAALPGHGVGGPDLEVIALLFGAFMLETSAGSLSPTAEHDNVTT